MDESSANIFNYCIGAFALCSTLASIYRYYRSILPAQKIVALNDVLTEIRDIYEKADADQLFPSDAEKHHAKSRLNYLEGVLNELRERVYSAGTPLQEFMSLVRGLSDSIADATCTAKKMRGTLLSITEEQRRQRLQNIIAAAQSPAEPSGSGVPGARQYDVLPTIQSPVVPNEQHRTQRSHSEQIASPGSSSIPGHPSPLQELLPPSRSPTLVAEEAPKSETDVCPSLLAKIHSNILNTLFGRWRTAKTQPSHQSNGDLTATHPDTLPPV